MDKKKILFIVGTILIVILGLVAITIGRKNVKEKEVDDNINNNVLKDTTVESFIITDQSVITRDGLSTYMANLTNTAKEKKHIDYLHIIFTIDGDVVDVIASRNIDVNSEAKLPIMISFDRDVSKASKVTYAITKEEK